MARLTAFVPLNTYNNFGERLASFDRRFFSDGDFMAEGPAARLVAEGSFVARLSGRAAGSVEALALEVLGEPALAIDDIGLESRLVLGPMLRGDLVGALGAVLAGDDTIRGSAHTDVVVASPGDDRIHLGAGADFFYTGPGDDTVRGGDDGALDTLVFGGPAGGRRAFEDLEIRAIDGGVEARDLVDGSTDRLFGFERFVFGERDYSAEEILVPGGVERAAAEQASLIYSAFHGLTFGFTNDARLDAFNDDIDRLHAGAGVQTVVEDLFAEDPYWTTGATLRSGTDEAFVRALYFTVLNRHGEEAGIGYWSGLIGSGAATRAETFEIFAFSEEGRAFAPAPDWLTETGPGEWAFAF